MALMGLIGLFRTGSIVPVLITGSLALLTFLLGWLVYRGSRRALVIATVWAALNTLLFTYIAVVPVGPHDPTRIGSTYIFGSMALVAFLIFVRLTGELRQWRAPRR